MCMILNLTGCTMRPLQQPRVIVVIIRVILLGPSAFGRTKKFQHTVFPKISMTVLDTLANLGLVFFLLLAGLELSMRAIQCTGTKAVAFLFCTSHWHVSLTSSHSFQRSSAGSFPCFYGVSLSITAFPVLAHILARLNLMTTDMGSIALSAAVVKDIASWILLAIAVTLSGTDSSPIVTVWVLLSGVGFITYEQKVVESMRILVWLTTWASPISLTLFGGTNASNDATN